MVRVVGEESCFSSRSGIFSSDIFGCAWIRLLGAKTAAMMLVLLLLLLRDTVDVRCNGRLAEFNVGVSVYENYYTSPARQD